MNIPGRIFIKTYILCASHKQYPTNKRILKSQFVQIHLRKQIMLYLKDI